MYVNVRAVVLSARRAGEKDKRLSLYTREMGRLSALAAGAARPGARLAAATEPGTESRFRLWTEPGGSFARLTGGGVERAFPGLRRAWARSAAAGSLLEWMDQLTASLQPHPAKYDLLVESLAALEDRDVDSVRSAFFVQFLEKAGYNPVEELSAAVPSGVLDALSAYDAASGSPVPGLKECSSLLEAQLLKFVAPLLARPLMAWQHETALKRFQKSSSGGEDSRSLLTTDH